MDWKHGFLLLCLISLSRAQNFAAYNTVDGNFTCNAPTRLERIILTSQCGRILSPCYPANYPIGLESGRKIWDLDSSSSVTAPILAYRFTLIVFETTGIDGALDFGTNVTFEPDTNINKINNAIVSVSGNSSTSPGADVRRGAVTTNVMVGQSIDVNASRLYLNLFTSREPPAQGFDISYCADEDECDASFTPAKCNTTISTCVRNDFRSYSCNCFTGYTGDPCRDVNECTAGSSPCVANSTCVNNDGSFTCTCDMGFTGDGNVNCTDINECVENDPCIGGNGTCVNNVGSYTCTCTTGYTWNGTHCVDNDECTSGNNNCHSNATCTNNPGSFTCTCKDGFSGNGTSCIDIDECADGTHSCATTARCDNTLGNYMCTCNPGFSGNGMVCVDIDECMDGTHNCNASATCTDTEGSFTCQCNPGFTGDGVSCIDINECMGNHSCHANATCVNEPGNFTCVCDSGYTGDGTNCTDINECTGTNMCDSNADCMNTLGNYTCSCRMGYGGSGFMCGDIDECATNASDCDAVRERCNNTVGSFTCLCDTPRFRGSPGNCDAICVGNTMTPAVCTIPGLLEWPINFDGVVNYQVNEQVTWFVNLTGQTSQTALRFTFNHLATEIRDDYVIFSTLSNFRNVSGHLAVITGDSRITNGIYNNLEPVNATNPDGFDTATNTYTIRRAEIYVHFISDRQITNTGFRIGFEPDMDDCMNVSSNVCQNNGTCLDEVFDYMCVNCTGYTGKNCDENIDECAIAGSCHMNATCTDNPGSFTCMCNAGFTGNGTFCQPLITLSNFAVVPSTNGTTSRLSVTFNVTSPWGNDIRYVTDYVITITNTANSQSTNYTTNMVNAANFMPTEFSVLAFVEYRVTVTVRTTGALFSTAVFTYATGSENLIITSDPITPLVPTNLNVTSQDEIAIRLSWMAPNETQRGATTGYQIEYVRSNADCTLYGSINRNVTDCTPQNVSITSAFTTYSFTGLQLYRTYEIRIRASTAAGFGAWSSNVTAFTGTQCPSGSRTMAIASPCQFERASMSSNNFPSPYTLFEEQFWQIKFTGDGAVRIIFDYVYIEQDQDFLDIGAGVIPEMINVTSSDITSITGDNTASGIPDLQYDETIQNMGLVFVRFSADIFRFKPGFQIHYLTNASQCVDNPCLFGGNCTPIAFDFTCTCPSLYTGKTCNQQLVEFIDFNCSPVDSSTFRVDWNVTTEYANDAAVISGYEVNYSPLPSPVSLAIGVNTYISPSTFSPYQSVSVTVKINGVSQATSPLEMTVECRTAEAQPNQPASVTATASGSTTIDVAWTEPTVINGVLTNYNISWVQTDASTYSETADSGNMVVGTMASPYTINGLRVFRQYSVSVAGITGGGTGPARTATATTSAGAPQGPVQGLTRTATQQSVTLVFNRPQVVTGTFMYRVEYVIGGVTQTVTESASPIVISGLSAGTQYVFTVYPVSAGTQNNPSMVTITTLEDVPGPVINLSAVAQSQSSISVTWEVPSIPNGVITGYRVTWFRSGGSVSEANVTSLTRLIDTLEVYTDYTITVYARTMIGQGQGATINRRTAEGAPQGPVQGVNVTPQTTGATLMITPPLIVTGVFTYDITYTPNGGTPTTLTNQNSPYTITGLAAGTSYTYTVYPRSGGQRGSNVRTGTFTTTQPSPGMVTSITAGPVAADSITVNWNPPTVTNGFIMAYRVTWSPGSPGDSGSLPASDRSFVIPNLSPYTIYTFTVFASNAIAEGPGSVITQRTSAIAPAAVTGISATVGSNNAITVTFSPPTPLNGALTNYTVTITQDAAECAAFQDSSCDPIQETFSSTTYTSQALTVYRNYVIEVAVITDGGTGPASSTTARTNVGVPGSASNVQTTSTSSTSITVMWATARPVAGPSNFTIVATPVIGGVPITRTLPINSALPNEAYTITGLQEGASYNITIQQSTSAGQGVTSSATNAFTAPGLLATAAPQPSTATQDLSGADPTSSYMIENPCSRASALFVGSLTSIEIIIKEVSSPETEPTVWSQAVQTNPLQPYVVGSVSCSQSRKKRQVTQNGNGYIIGFQGGCSRTSSQVCNGPLVNMKQYHSAYRGVNSGGTSNITSYGAPFSPVPISGLDAGEIAAIVICSLVVLALLIVLIVFCIRRRKSSGKMEVGGSDNPVYAESSKQHRYKVDPDAQAPTTYSEQTATN